MTQVSSNLTPTAYQRLYQQSLAEPEQFWGEHAQQFISWQQNFSKVLTGDLAQANVRWFSGGRLNACYNCIDRHLPQHANKTALIWQADDPTLNKRYSYQQLHDEVCQMANCLSALGVKANDTVCIYLPMIPEAVIAMLACARIGAIHTVVFSGFSASALAGRLQDAKCQLLITADVAFRAGKRLALKHVADQALQVAPAVQTCLVIRQTTDQCPWQTGRDQDYHRLKNQQASDCEPVWRDSHDPLFILYTSGSTGKPKGVVHGTGGYMVYAATTYYYVFNHQANDVFWCTADVGWITGHSYLVYGPLANATTILMYEGVPCYPDASRLWHIIDDFKVSIFYTAPTLIRLLMREGDQHLQASRRDSLRLLGSVGEPINPAAWQWFYQQVGQNRCPIVDTWWQTETGGIMMAPLAVDGDAKPGACRQPFFGVAPALVDDENQRVTTALQQANLVITQAWPGMLQTVYGDHQRFITTYLQTSPGNYFTGDCSYRDEAGDYWILGRIDDVINVSGHRLGTAEIESAIVAVAEIAEAAVVAIAHPIKGQGVYAFVTTKAGIQGTDALAATIADSLRQEIGPIAKLDALQWVDQLPKTRSGKIMRRILRKIANNDTSDLGDTSTMADGIDLTQLIANRILCQYDSSL